MDELAPMYGSNVSGGADEGSDPDGPTALRGGEVREDHLPYGPRGGGPEQE